MGLSGTLKLIVDFLDQDVHDLSTIDDKFEKKIIQSFTDGTGDQELNRLWYDQRTLSLASGTDLLDLAGGLTDRWGNTITFTEVKLLLVYNRGVRGASIETPTHGEDLLVGGAGAGADAWISPFDGDADAKVNVRSDGILWLSAPYDGYSVSAGAGDVLKIQHNGSEASGGDIVYDIVLMGVGMAA